MPENLDLTTNPIEPSAQFALADDSPYTQLAASIVLDRAAEMYEEVRHHSRYMYGEHAETAHQEGLKAAVRAVAPMYAAAALNRLLHALGTDLPEDLAARVGDTAAALCLPVVETLDGANGPAPAVLAEPLKAIRQIVTDLQSFCLPTADTDTVAFVEHLDRVRAAITLDRADLLRAELAAGVDMARDARVGDWFATLLDCEAILDGKSDPLMRDLSLTELGRMVAGAAETAHGLSTAP